MENPRKRVKTEHEEAHTRLELQSPDLWIDDGNIILRARAEGPDTDEPAYTLFRVHKGLLGTQAAYFRRLSLEGISERMDGIPVLDLPESASDVDDFLRALYLPNHLNSFPAAPDENQFVNRANFPAVLAGMLRMCKNYEAPALGDIVKAKLRNEWPASLAKWDSMQDAISRYPDARRAVGFADPVTTIRLAREHSIPEALPAAFYDLARVYTFDTQATDFCHRKLDLEKLPAEDIAALVKGIAQLRRYIVLSPSIYISREPDFSACLFQGNGPSCQEVINDAWNRNRLYICGAGDVLRRLEGFMEMLAHLVDGTVPVAPGRTRASVCAKCRSQAMVNVQLRREMIWSSLPAIFGLTSLLGDKWPKLKAL